MARDHYGLECLAVCHKSVLSCQFSENSFLAFSLRTENCCHAFSIFTKKPLNSGVYAFGSITVGVS